MDKSTKISKNEYIKLKNFAYYAYDFYNKASDEKACSFFQECMNRYETEEERVILANTLICPFDMELQQFLSNNKLTQDNVEIICQRFKITPEIIDYKSREYVKYDYVQCVGEGSIDYDIILELSKKFVEKGPIDRKI